MPDLLVREVDFTGGEPLLRHDWRQIASRLRELKIATKLITNGLLLQSETIAYLKDVGIARVGISLDGLEDTHDRLRGRHGLFRHILRGIELLLNAGIPVTAITTVNTLNLIELPVLATVLQSHGVESWQVQPVFPLGRTRECMEIVLDDTEYMKLGHFTQSYQEQNAITRPTLLPGDSYGYYTELDARKPSWGGCSAGLVTFGITSDGRVKGCLSMPDEISEGNVRENDLWEIWFNPDAFSYNRNFTRTDLGPNCLACERAETCRGGCTAMSLAWTGRMHNNPLCFYRIQRQNRSAI